MANVSAPSSPSAASADPVDHEDFVDFAIVGSGFGGSVSAMRLAEKGYSVLVLEKGKRFEDRDFAVTNWDLRRYLWMPLLKCFGIQNMSLFNNVMILSGVGVGGGSLVYANTLLQPSSDEFYKAPIWRDLADWRAELDPHYATARRMLGVTPFPRLTYADRILQQCAADMGKADSFKLADVGVFFGQPGESGKTVADPYFGGQGPDRTACVECGGCMVGCRFNAKNTLRKNYLWFAEKLGVRIQAERQVTDIVPLGSQGRPDRAADGTHGYEIHTARSTAWLAKDRRAVRARNIVLSGGVLGTMDLLLKCKHVTRSLPRVSERLGYEVRTNSEALIGVTELEAPKGHDCSEGVAITSIVHIDDHTHVEPVRYPRGSSFMRMIAAPMVDTESAWRRPFYLVASLMKRPIASAKVLFTRDWAARTIILLVMQTIDAKMRLRLGRGLLTVFRTGMVTAPDDGGHAHATAAGKLARKAPLIPTFIPIGYAFARLWEKRVHGLAQSSIPEALLGIPTTAHILGGCPISGDAAHGVIDASHRVYGYRGLYVCDGSAIPANLGVNPSLTIAAMTERAMSLIPTKPTARG